MRALRVLALALVALGTSACLRPYPVEEPVPDAGVDAGLPDSEVSLFHPMPGASASLTFLTTPALAGHVFVANANQLWSWPASQGAPAGSTAPFEIAPGSFSGAPIAALVPGDYGAIVVTRGASSFRLSLAPGDASLIEETTVDGTTGEIAGTRNRVATSLGLYVRAANQWTHHAAPAGFHDPTVVFTNNVRTVVFAGDAQGGVTIFSGNTDTSAQWPATTFAIPESTGLVAQCAGPLVPFDNNSPLGVFLGPSRTGAPTHLFVGTPTQGTLRSLGAEAPASSCLAGAGALGAEQLFAFADRLVRVQTDGPLETVRDFVEFTGTAASLTTFSPADGRYWMAGERADGARGITRLITQP